MKMLLVYAFHICNAVQCHFSEQRLNFNSLNIMQPVIKFKLCGEQIQISKFKQIYLDFEPNIKCFKCLKLIFEIDKDNSVRSEIAKTNCKIQSTLAGCEAYLIFVIYFTQTGFWIPNFTPKNNNNNKHKNTLRNTPKIAKPINQCLFQSTIHRIF